LANLGKIIPIPDKIVVDCVQDGAREQENIRGHLRLLPTLLHPIELVQFFREVTHHFPDRGKGI